MTPLLFADPKDALDTGDNQVFPDVERRHDTDPAPPPSPMTPEEQAEWIAYALETFAPKDETK